jgi:hypothetical protein
LNNSDAAMSLIFLYMLVLVQCSQRWEKVLRPDLIKGKWTEEEDQKLIISVQEGFERWGDIAAKLPGRTSKQCRERWSNYLDPALSKTPFTSAEDEQLCNLQRQMGNRWSTIARQMPGRTENTVKLRFNALAKAAASGRPVPPMLHAKRSNSVSEHDDTSVKGSVQGVSEFSTPDCAPVVAAPQKHVQPPAKRIRLVDLDLFSHPERFDEIIAQVPETGAPLHPALSQLGYSVPGTLAVVPQAMFPECVLHDGVVYPALAYTRQRTEGKHAYLPREAYDIVQLEAGLGYHNYPQIQGRN